VTGKRITVSVHKTRRKCFKLIR